MIKKLTILLLFLPLCAAADHHIGHDYMNLDKAEASLNKVRNAVRYMPICSNWTPLQVDFATVGIVTRMNMVQQGIDDTRAALQAAQSTHALIEASTGDTSALEQQLKDELFLARTLMSQPAWPNNGSPNGAEYNAGYLIVIGKYLIEDHNVGPSSVVCPEAAKLVAQIMLNATVTVRWLGIADWHREDANNELVYEDSDFICSGPNNHCE